jgi:histone H3/H4
MCSESCTNDEGTHPKTETFTFRRGRTASMADVIVKAAVRDAVGDLNVGGDFYDELDAEVQTLLDDAERRAQDNDRKTVQARDL